jgi:uncharacterized protein (DUF362 family)
MERKHSLSPIAGNITRRNFLKAAALVSAGCIHIPVLSHGQRLRRKTMATVAITHNKNNIEAAVVEALNQLPLEQMVSGKRVAVKPNDTWASSEDKTAVTQPETLRGVLRHLKQLHPRELLVTGGAGAAETDEVFKAAGLMQVVEQEEAVFFDHNRPPFQKVELPRGSDTPEVQGPQQTVMVNPRVLEYDVLISLAQLKLHEVATVTLSLKNIAMSFPAADYYGHPRHSEKHENAFFDDMHSFVALMTKRFPIHLAIIAGHPVMIGTGPIGGHTFKTGLVIASIDPVAADVVGARLLGFKAQGVRHLWEAGLLGLGETNISKMEFPALSLQEAIGTFTEAAYGKRLSFDHP